MKYDIESRNKIWKNCEQIKTINWIIDIYGSLQISQINHQTPQILILTLF